MKDLLNLDSEFENKSELSKSLRYFIDIIFVFLILFIFGFIGHGSVFIFSSLTFSDFYLSTILLSAIFIVFHLIIWNKRARKIITWLKENILNKIIDNKIHED